jgi:hypothetical protein
MTFTRRLDSKAACYSKPGGRRSDRTPAPRSPGDSSASAGLIPAARTARTYFETAPTDSPSARAVARTLKLLACSAISCFNFDMETLWFGIDLAPQDKKSPA